MKIKAPFIFQTFGHVIPGHITLHSKRVAVVSRKQTYVFTNLMLLCCYNTRRLGVTLEKSPRVSGPRTRSEDTRRTGKLMEQHVNRTTKYTSNARKFRIKQPDEELLPSRKQSVSGLESDWVSSTEMPEMSEFRQTTGDPITLAQSMENDRHQDSTDSKLKVFQLPMLVTRDEGERPNANCSDEAHRDDKRTTDSSSEIGPSVSEMRRAPRPDVNSRVMSFDLGHSRTVERRRSFTESDCRLDELQSEIILTGEKRAALQRLKKQIHKSNLDTEKQKEGLCTDMRLIFDSCTKKGKILLLPVLEDPAKEELLRKRRHTLCNPGALRQENSLREKKEEKELFTEKKQELFVRAFPRAKNCSNCAVSESNQLEPKISHFSEDQGKHLPRHSCAPTNTEIESVRWFPLAQSEPCDFESINAMANRFQSTPRAKSEPGDLEAHKSWIGNFLNISRSETDHVKEKVHMFLEKKNPARPHASLRLSLSDDEIARQRGVPRRSRQTNVKTTERNKSDEVINVHNCPNLNMFNDRSWIFRDKESKCRYLRSPATPIPPVEYVFEKDTARDPIG